MGSANVALVAMSWASYDRPAAAFPALAAYLKAKRKNTLVCCYYEFLCIADLIERELYDKISADVDILGELFYCSILYPGRQATIADYYAKRAKRLGIIHPEVALDFAAIRQHLQTRLDTLSAELVGKHDVIGLTTCYKQSFANLALAQRIKSLRPDCLVVFGDSSVSFQGSTTLLQEYPQIDFLVHGEGEGPLLRIVEAVEEGTVTELRSERIISRVSSMDPQKPGFEDPEIADLESLPLPDFDEYSRTAEDYDFDWTMSLETSRGCWWDRTFITGNPSKACAFCNRNLQWRKYREKTVEQVVQELDVLSDQHRKLQVNFVDNTLRNKDAELLAQGISSTGKQLKIFAELRANISPRVVLSLHEAGLAEVQFGIEALSRGILKRIGKGTTAIQNLL